MKGCCWLTCLVLVLVPGGKLSTSPSMPRCMLACSQLVRGDSRGYRMSFREAAELGCYSLLGSSLSLILHADEQ